MEDSEEIELLYEKEMENADKEFLNNLQKIKNKKDPREAYKEKIKSIRIMYEKRYEKYIKYQKKNLSGDKEKKRKSEIEKKEFFKVENITLKPTWVENQKRKYEFFRFRTKIKKRNFLRKVTPKSLLIFQIKTKMGWKRASLYTHESLRKTISKTKEALINFFKNNLERASSTWSKIKNKSSEVMKKITGKFKWKKKGKEEKMTEDQKIAEKILGKSS